MAITALTVLKHGNEDGEVLEWLPGEEVADADVEDEVMLLWVENGSVLVTGKDRDLFPEGIEVQMPEPPPITSAADPRYLQQVKEQRESDEKAKEDRLAAFKKGENPMHPQENVDDGLPKAGAKAKGADGTTAATESDAEKAREAALEAAKALEENKK
jgi:hypothetical protein